MGCKFVFDYLILTLSPASHPLSLYTAGPASVHLYLLADSILLHGQERVWSDPGGSVGLLQPAVHDRVALHRTHHQPQEVQTHFQGSSGGILQPSVNPSIVHYIPVGPTLPLPDREDAAGTALVLPALWGVLEQMVSVASGGYYICMCLLCVYV